MDINFHSVRLAHSQDSRAMWSRIEEIRYQRDLPLFNCQYLQDGVTDEDELSNALSDSRL